MDWRDVLRERGVAVWSGAKAIDTSRNGWPTVTVLDDGTTSIDPDPECMVSQWPYVDRYTVSRSHLVVALDDPDTQPAYLRRLAVRLGCPEEVAGEGVVADVMRPDAPWSDPDQVVGPHLLIGAGAPKKASDNRYRWSATIKVATHDRILALALAWPKALVADETVTESGG